MGLIWKQSNYPAAASLRWAVTIGHSGFPRTSEAIGPTTAAAAWCVATRPGSFGAERSVIVLWKECRMLEAGHGRCGLHRSRIPWGEGPCPRPQLLASHDSVGNAFVFICGGHGTIMFDRRVRRTINIIPFAPSCVDSAGSNMSYSRRVRRTINIIPFAPSCVDSAGTLVSESDLAASELETFHFPLRARHANSNSNLSISAASII